MKGWVGFQLAVEEVERRLGLSWGAAQKTLLDACEAGELTWQKGRSGFPEVMFDDLFRWLDAKRRRKPAGKQTRLVKLLAKLFPNGVPDDCVRKALRADLIKLDPTLAPLNLSTLKTAIDDYNANPKRS